MARANSRQGSRRLQRGFSLLETFVALILVAVAMTALLVAFVNSGKYGVLSRRQATALTVARSLALQLNESTWTFASSDTSCTTTGIDPRLVNNNTGNDATFADPNGLFAQSTIPTGTDAPDWPAAGTTQTITVGSETYETYVNVAPDADSTGTLNGMNFAVIVRYKVGQQYMRAVALGYRYCPKNMSIGMLPI